MLEPEQRSAIYQLHRAGVPLRQISRQFHVSRNTVRAIVRQQGDASRAVRSDKIQIDAELLGQLYQDCDGWIERVHEKLIEEEKIDVGYSTLTRLLREMGLGKSQKKRCHRVPDEPGAEMQHDTTDYKIKLSGVPTKLIASSLYLRYSKRRYLKFYRVFNRFAMKCFLHEGLTFWEYAAWRCIIDNTNLARLRGTGSQAVIVPEMVTFAQRYGFEFICHEVKHANRKAGEERSFWTVETNFLPGRSFENLDDLNRQAFEWATKRIDQRPMAKTGLIPAKAFEHEREYLHRLSSFVPPPYRTHQRGTDQYGYAAFAANYYWVPGSRRDDVKVIEYADRIKIYQRRECVAEYRLPPSGVKEQRFSPEGQPPPPHEPKNRKRGSEQEEKRLRAMNPDVAAYLDELLKTPGIQRHRFMRELFALSRQVPERAFLEAIERAGRYGVVHLESIRRIAWYCMSTENFVPESLTDVPVDEHYRERPAYQEGSLTDEPDLSIYDETLSDDSPTQSDESETDNE